MRGRALRWTAIAAAAGCLLGAAATALGQVEAAPVQDKMGGETTVYATGRNAFSFPAANLDDSERTRFAIGNSFFRRNWVQAGGSTTARDGLGPHFIARSCAGCHVHDGRGAPPQIRNRLSSEQPIALLLRLSVPGAPAPGFGVVPEPVYGEQFNNAAIQRVRPEGEVVVRQTLVRGRFADGSPYVLRKPDYSFRKLAYGPMHPQVRVSPRIAPQLIGVGLLEAIDEREILGNAKAQAATPGPIKGTPNQVWDAYAGRTLLGRFGWKANVATLAHQTAGAFLGDMGITSAKFAHETCTARQEDCLQAVGGARQGPEKAPEKATVKAPDNAPEKGSHKGPQQAPQKGPEIDDQILDNVVFYQATLAPPARRNARDPQVLAGQKLFARAQCAACHRPSYVTAQGPFARLTSKALSGQTIHPYTDLLLHDMGEGLADGRPDFLANGRQWKTPPLWGIGLIRDVNGHQRLLHDGRADGVLEAILWHGGEAQDSRDAVLQFNAQERAALVKFVESL